MLARFNTWRMATPTWWLTTLGTVFILIWLVLDFIAVMVEQPDTFAWILGFVGIELLAIGNLIPLYVSPEEGTAPFHIEHDRRHWRGVAEACFGVIVIGTQLFPHGPAAYALMAAAAWLCFLSVLAFALRWRWPFRKDDSPRVSA
jgi:hypothetical protein